jgi:hypothetical protein
MGIGKCLGLQDAAPADMKMRVKAHLSSEEVGPWLLIIDNADDMNIWTTSGGSSPTIKTYIPKSNRNQRATLLNVPRYSICTKKSEYESVHLIPS